VQGVAGLEVGAVSQANKSSRLLWSTVPGTPLLWIAQLVLNHILTPVLCRAGRGWVLHVITASFALIAGSALYFSARAWGRSAHAKPASETFAATEAVAQTQFLAVVATMTCTFFLMLIIATGVPAMVVGPCTLWGSGD
jgi:hypothetical protein